MGTFLWHSVFRAVLILVTVQFSHVTCRITRRRHHGTNIYAHSFSEISELAINVIINSPHYGVASQSRRTHARTVWTIVSEAQKTEFNSQFAGIRSVTSKCLHVTMYIGVTGHGTLTGERDPRSTFNNRFYSAHFGAAWSLATTANSVSVSLWLRVKSATRGILSCLESTYRFRFQPRTPLGKLTAIPLTPGGRGGGNPSQFLVSMMPWFVCPSQQILATRLITACILPVVPIYYVEARCGCEPVGNTLLWRQRHLATVVQHAVAVHPPSCTSFLYLTRLFWNQIFTCFSDRRRAAAIWIRRSLDRYMLAANSCSSRSNCVLVNAVRSRFMDTLPPLAPSGDWHLEEPSSASASAIVDVTEPVHRCTHEGGEWVCRV